MGCCGPCECKAAVEILEGDDVPATTMDEPFHRVQSNAMTRMSGFEVFWLAGELLTIHFPWLFLSKIRMLHPQILDLIQNFQRPHTNATPFRRLRSFIQSSALSMAFFELFLP